MSLKKDGCIVKCEHCQCVSNDGSGGFDVKVPICSDKDGISGTARLHCVVSPEHHQVELMDWEDDEHHPVLPPNSVRQRLSSALNFVADHRVCGNQKICPLEIIQIVEKQADQ
ncbi:MAG: hypothetical protein KZQ85_14545 [Candidatus Thiodiazotropha sp. (ex Myrtea sp. 'scaly one' KF741663)]|nr:hypothetical protein [Candidatus Thiodiazotropha sp. (ex Myrtea sp. 'scaly one' KF741663)]